MTTNAFGTDKDALTTGEVARICNVAARTVSKWIDAGRLDGYRIPGSRDRRVHVTALEAFIAAHNIPVRADALAGGTATRVLFVDPDRSATGAVRQVFADLGGFTFESAADALGAAIASGASTPDVIVFDAAAGDPVAFVTALRTRPNFARTRFVATASAHDDSASTLLRRGFDAVVAKPYSVRALLDAIGGTKAAFRNAG
jgi:excisionase family DNA binding protein